MVENAGNTYYQLKLFLTSFFHKTANLKVKKSKMVGSSVVREDMKGTTRTPQDKLCFLPS